MPRDFAPARGDVVWLNFTPEAGHKQAGDRPALVLSPEAYNRKVGLALVCPITTQVKGYPFEVLLPAGSKLRGAVLSDQVKSLNWRARQMRRFGKAPESVMAEVLGKIGTLLT